MLIIIIFLSYQGKLKAKFASAGNRTRAARVAGEHSTTEPPMHTETENKPFIRVPHMLHLFKLSQCILCWILHTLDLWRRESIDVLQAYLNHGTCAKNYSIKRVLCILSYVAICPSLSTSTLFLETNYKLSPDSQHSDMFVPSCVLLWPFFVINMK